LHDCPRRTKLFIEFIELRELRVYGVWRVEKVVR